MRLNPTADVPPDRDSWAVAATCEECSDVVPEREGCRHDGHVWCASCFIERCAECRADLIDEMSGVEQW